MPTITTKDSHKIHSKKRTGFSHRIPALLTIGALVSVGLAAADDDGSIRPPAPAAVAPTNTPNDFAPMTRSERLSNYLVGLGNYEWILFSAASGGIQQVSGTPKEWGGGAAAYGDRFGSSFAQHVIRRTLTYGLSSALHETIATSCLMKPGFSGGPNMRSRARSLRGTTMAASPSPFRGLVAPPEPRSFHASGSRRAPRAPETAPQASGSRWGAILASTCFASSGPT